MDQRTLYLIGVLVTLAICIFVAISFLSSNSRLRKHPMLANVKFWKLKPDSQTRQRLERAALLFQEGWTKMASEEPGEQAACLKYFAEAVEIDEGACGWQQNFEAQLGLIGDLFAAKQEDQEAAYHSLLAEAWLVLLMNTVVGLYGKPAEDPEEDYRVVKSRLDECAKLQPRNPAVFKLRGDWCMRFTEFADRDAATRDFQKAIRLCETDGCAASSHGVDPSVQKSYLLAFCHCHLGRIMQQKKEFESSRNHYEAAAKHADADLPLLPDVLFSLSVLTMLTIESSDDRQAALSRAARYYKDGSAAVKRLRKWNQTTLGFETTQKLANTLLPKFAAASQLATARQHARQQEEKDE